jgi:hypothetical protein
VEATKAQGMNARSLKYMEEADTGSHQLRTRLSDNQVFSHTSLSDDIEVFMIPLSARNIRSRTGTMAAII